MKRRQFLIILTALAIPVSFISAPYPRELVLQHVPTLLGISLFGFAVWRFQPSRTSFGCCIVFLWLHIIGARWIYSFVPYDDVSLWLTGTTLTETFGWQRNHYDRLVHFASGVLGLPPISELLQSRLRISLLPAALLAMACVLAIGAGYEILEWQITTVFSHGMAEYYNGQQGDVWDAQKDLALAWAGALICVPLVAR